MHLLQNTDFFSVCFDSSTDKATIDEEMVQIRVLIDNSPVYRFVAVKPLVKADAAGTVNCVVSALETECECSEWKFKLVGICADGATVNMGVRTGAAKRMQDEVPHLIPVHCCAHRVELAVKTVSTDVDYFKSLEATLVELYKLYHKSPLCWNGLQQVGQVLDARVLKPVNLGGTRWVAHRQRALTILLDSWRCFVVHTSEVSQGSTMNKSRALHLHTTLTSLKFLLFARPCAEFLAAIQHLSKMLQYDDITSDGVIRRLAATKERLENMHSSMDTAISTEVERFGDDLTYQGETLKVPRGYASKSAVVTAVSTLMKKLLAGAIEAINNRFATFNSSPVLMASKVFSPFSWPTESSAFAAFGYSEIQQLSSHFAYPLQHQGYSPDSCIEEWPELKLRVREILTKEPTMKYLPMWRRILNEYKENPALTNVLALLRIVLVIPVQTATLERGFSLMKRTKTDWRNRLSPKTLSQLMMIKLNGPDMDHFNPEAAIMKWWQAGPRSRRLIHYRHQSESETSESEEDCEL